MTNNVDITTLEYKPLAKSDWYEPAPKPAPKTKPEVKRNKKVHIPAPTPQDLFTVLGMDTATPEEKKAAFMTFCARHPGQAKKLLNSGYEEWKGFFRGHNALPSDAELATIVRVAELIAAHKFIRTGMVKVPGRAKTGKFTSVETLNA